MVFYGLMRSHNQERVPMLTCKYDLQFGEVVYPSEITALTAYALRQECLVLAKGYHYKVISIVFVENFGGDVTGLAIIRNTFNDLANEGVIVKTRGVGTVASAAALMLSLGTLGHRDVLIGTNLLYHFARVGSQAALTNQVARQLGKRLESHDDSMLHCLVEHCAPLTMHCGPGQADKPIYRWPLTSIDDVNLPRIDLAQKQFPDITGCKQYMSDTLRIVFEADTVMETNTAKALGLIDAVCTNFN